MLTVQTGLENQLPKRSKQKYVLKKQNHSKEDNIKTQYANKLVQNLGMGDPTTFFYQFIYDQNFSDDTKIIQYCIMQGLGIFIKVDSYVAHMFFAWSFSYSTAVPTDIKKNKYFLSMNKNTTVFDWVAVNFNKNRAYKIRFNNITKLRSKKV